MATTPIELLMSLVDAKPSESEQNIGEKFVEEIMKPENAELHKQALMEFAEMHLAEETEEIEDDEE